MSTSDFQVIYNTFRKRVLSYLSHFVGKDDAEDLTQEVFEKIDRSLGRFEERSRISTWIFRIATNAALDRIKSPSFSRSPVTSLINYGGCIPTGQKDIPIDQQIIRKEMSACVREYVYKLPREYRAVIILSELEGFKKREIADILQVSLATVKIRLHRARARLRKLLESGCDFYYNKQSVLACDRKPPIIKSNISD
jgi:RNA polymerase sigma-70 factor (ECF subfamily)